MTEEDNSRVLKTRQQAKNGVVYAKPHFTKPRLNLNYSFGSRRNGILNHSIRNPLISTS